VKAVLKWHVPVDDRAHPVGHGPVVLVACQWTPDVVTVWTLDGDVPVRASRTVQVYGTGQPVPDGATHLGSTLTADGALVWHLFEVGQ
jgi:hypothetical protein